MASQQGKDVTTAVQGEMKSQCSPGTSGTNAAVQHSSRFSDLPLLTPYLKM